MSTYIHYTNEQKERARSTDLADLLQRQGEQLKRSGKEYQWRDGSNKVTIRGNLWYPQFEPVPYIMNGATDSRYFTRVCDNCLRFVPFKIDNQQLNSVHGIDESVDIDTLAPAVDFYKYVIKEV